MALNSSGSAATAAATAAPVPDVERQREDLRTELGREVLDAVHAAGGRDDARPVGGEPAGHRGTEAAARAGNEDRSTHGHPIVKALTSAARGAHPASRSTGGLPLRRHSTLIG